MTSRSISRRTNALPLAAVAVLLLGGCVEIGPGGPEAKIGAGPFKAGSLELGPGGAEAKGPSAGPVKAGSVEAGPGGVETKGLSAGPLEAGVKDTGGDADDPDQETQAEE